MGSTGTWALGPDLAVPANASRFLPTADLARKEPSARLRLAWNSKDPYVFNEAFDGSLIRHDSYYCTTVVDIAGEPQLPTLGYFMDRISPFVLDGRVIDIGCGRGEFVAALRRRGVDAIGYDPVLPAATEHLRDRYWTPGDEAAVVYVMRCVLPHIPDPWEWVLAMGAAHPNALLLVEYQRLEWIIEQGLWYQFSHDHVNQFVAEDFRARFEVLDEGQFNEGEWGWSLVRPSSYQRPGDTHDPPDLSALWQRRDKMVELDQPVVLWGAAGKGIVLAHALLEAGVQVPFAIDADPNRRGLFMEVSGVPVLGPAEGLERLPRETRIHVCNPSHRASILASGVRTEQLLEFGRLN